MDNTEQYTKMRIAAIADLGVGISPELTPGAEVTWLTTFVFVDRIGNLFYSQINRSLPETILTCQLERQDQLQEMVGDCNNPYPLIERFYEYALNSTRLEGSEWIMLSMEQLWLAFVMKEKFLKAWNGEAWISA